MKTSYWETTLGITIAAAIFACGLALGFIVNRLPTAPGDAATWTGALLAGLAFGGTIWIATKDRRDRIRRERSKAYVQAHLVSIKLGELRKRFQTYTEIFPTAQDKNRAFIVMRDNLKQANLATIDDLNDLICLRGNIARDISILLTTHQTISFMLNVGSELRNGTQVMDKQVKELMGMLIMGVALVDGVAPRLKAYIDSRVDSDEE